MRDKLLVKNIMTCYAAGTFGALVNSFAMYLAQINGFETMFGVSLFTDWTLAWVYPRLVWGGMLAMVFVIPVFRYRPVIRGLVWSIIPTIPHLFIIFPGQADLIEGYPGFTVTLTSLIFLYIFNCFWGLTTSYVLYFFHEQ